MDSDNPGQRRVIEVAAGLIFHEGELLLAQRNADAHLANLWEFPGGKREPAESFEECLKRELLEELSVEVDVLELIESVDHDYPERSVHIRFFKCRLLSGPPIAVDCQAIAWVTPEKLSDYPFPAADDSLLERLRSSPQLWV